MRAIISSLEALAREVKRLGDAGIGLQGARGTARRGS